MPKYLLNAEYNDNVSILNGSWKIAVYVHGQYKFGQKQPRFPRTSGATSDSLKLQCIRNFKLFSYSSYLSKQYVDIMHV